MKLTPGQIESWVARHFEYKKKSGGHQLVINNPFNGDTGWHFWIATYSSIPQSQHGLPKKEQREDYYCHDFRPGEWSGSFIRLVKEYRNISYFDAIREIKGGSAKTVREAIRQEIAKSAHAQQEDAIEPEEKIVELPPKSKPMAEGGKTKQRDIALNYLKGRRISEETAIENYVHYRAGAVVFPYIEYGMMVYWQERSILSKDFLFPDEIKTGLKKSDYIYGFDHIEPGGTAILVESIFNKLSVGKDTGAIGGAIITGKQIQKLRALKLDVIILAPDHDEAGIKSLRKNFDVLRPLPSKLAYSMPPDPDQDWNDMDRDYGVGSARKYLENNTYALTLKKITRLSLNLPAQK